MYNSAAQQLSSGQCDEVELSVGSWGGGQKKASISPPLKKGMVLALPIPPTCCED